MNSVSEREPRAGKKDDGGPAGGRVRARLPAKPMNSVLERELRAGKKDDGGPAAGRAADFFHIYINYFVFKVVK